jgi:phosphoribosylaminoimidazolecarboxamide formyltransferase/IMP cyclohydrolase
MSQSVQIKNALISVYYKDHLEPVIQELKRLGVKIYSTGGTETFIRSVGAEVVAVEDLTSYPSILGGRVKTLHPKVFGGILARRNFESDEQQLSQYEIPEIDLVIVDLYPFEETVRSGAGHDDVIEKIDIGGISLIRAAAKNFKDVVIVASKDDYLQLGEILKTQDGATTLDQRRQFAQKAFNITSHYDTSIFQYFNLDQGEATPALPVFKQSIQTSQTLRYGENPHQQGTFYGNLNAMFTKLHGKELSYNNLVDVDAAVALIDEFTDPTIAILKHTNACGIATRSFIKEAWVDALAEISKLFFEVLIAPAYTDEALQILKEKKNRIILIRQKVELGVKQFKTLLNGVIEQDKDLVIEGPEQMTTVTEQQPTAQELKDLFFANKVVKHTKSNTVVLAKNNQLVASGVGQTSRVDALRQAIEKARSFGFDLQGAVMASDAFFPFPDCVEIAADAGITAVLQPGGSIKDQDSVNMCNQKGISMVTTGVRHFKH